MFVAMNRISCTPDYIEKFEHMFKTRAGEVDKMPGFHWVKILRPLKEDQPYVIMSYWDEKSQFEDWMKHEAFKLGHKRGFDDIAAAKAEGKEPPLKSTMELYEVFAE